MPFFFFFFFLSARMNVEEKFLKPLLQYRRERLTDEDGLVLESVLQELWGGLKAKFEIQLPFPSVQIGGVVDFQSILDEKHVFVKMKIPQFHVCVCFFCIFVVFGLSNKTQSDH